MKTFLTHCLCMILLSLGVSKAGFAQPQAPDCNSCACVPSGFNFDAILADPGSGPTGTANSVSCVAGRTYRRFDVTAGNTYRVSLCGTAVPMNTVLSISTNQGSFPQVLGACDDDGCGVSNGHASLTWTPSITGTFRAYFYAGSCGPGNEITAPVELTVTYLGPVATPVNDDPCGAIMIPGPLPTSCSGPIAATTLGATATVVSSLGVIPLTPTNACISPSVQYNGGDVWFQFAVPPSGLVGIETMDGANCAGGFGLYTASSCTGTFSMLSGTAPNSGLCSIEGLLAPGGGDAGLVFNAFDLGQSVGDMVYVRYWERNNNELGPFSICVYDPVPPPNNDPCGAVMIPTLSSCVPVEYYTTNATISIEATFIPDATCFPVLGGDVWFQVVVPPSGSLTVTASAGTLTDMAMEWYRLTSGSLCTSPTLTRIACDDNSGSGNMPSINSQTYSPAISPQPVPDEAIYVRMYNAANSYFGTFNICAIENLPPPNDEPCAAINLDVSPSCELIGGTTLNGTATQALFNGGTILGAIPSCGGTPNTDVWYSLTVPNDISVPYGIQISTLAGDLTDATMQVYAASGSCTTSDLQLTPLGPCQAGAPMPASTYAVPTVTPGQQVYVRIWSANTQNGSFTICAVRTDPFVCVGSATDPGGSIDNYPDNSNVSTTYCADKVGDVVTLTFSEFDLELNSDFLTIYNGPSANSPLIGNYTGTTNLNAITATYDEVDNPTGCLTLVFTSNGSVTRPGYVAKITCGPDVPPDNVGDLIYDPGGPNGNYPDSLGILGNPPWIETYCCTTPGEVVTLHFDQFEIESYGDHLYIFDGPSPASPLISSGNGPGFEPNMGPGAWWGNSMPDITSVGSCITLGFLTNDSVNFPGWEAHVLCGPPPPPPGTTCGTTFLDPGGYSYYPNNQDSISTICAPVGEVVRVDFQMFDLETNWDRLYVYDGPNIASPQISSCNGIGIGEGDVLGPGGFWGTGPIGPFISSGNCLTFRFFSDGIIVRAGWQASITCAPTPSNNDPCPPGVIDLPVSQNCNFTPGDNTLATTTSGMTTGTGYGGCGNYQGGDVWYRFVAPSDGTFLISTQEGTLTDAVMSLYEAENCSGPYSLVEFDDDDGPGNMPEIDRRCSPLVPGETYYIRVWGFNATRGTFGICVTGGYNGIPQGDCLGANVICDGDVIMSEPSNPGCVNDLNNVNWGCLSVGEEIGSWYAFQASANGSLGMTITPAGAEDLDWAIWGPFPTGSVLSSLCPLSIDAGPPKRCSYTSSTLTNNATGTYATGMGGPFGPGDGPIGTPEVDINENGWTPGFSDVSSGDIFLLYVNDHHHSADSYTISWQLATPDMLNCITLEVDDQDQNEVSQSDPMIVPNPTHGTTELVFTEVQNEIVVIRITDSGGRLVGETRSTAGVQRVALPTEKLEQGTYFVRMNTLDGAPRGVTRFVKQ